MDPEEKEVEAIEEQVTGEENTTEEEEEKPEIKEVEEEKPEEKKVKGKPWFQSRIDELTASNYTTKDELAKQKKINESLLEKLADRKEDGEENPKTPTGLTQKQLEEKIREQAENLRAAEKFNEACEKVYTKGEAEYEDFASAVDNLKAAGALNAENPAFITTVIELDDSHKVLHHLGSNPEEAQRIAKLSPAKMAIELTRLEASLNKKEAKSVSKVASPLTPVRGTARKEFDLADPDTDLREWMKKREKQLAERNR